MKTTEIDYDIYECYDCGYTANINYMDISCATDEDPNPVITCPKCGGCCEQCNNLPNEQSEKSQY
jgi:hypothetical protein